MSEACNAAEAAGVQLDEPASLHPKTVSEGDHETDVVDAGQI